MCGIAGLWDSTLSYEQGMDRVRRMSDFLRHRGPDAVGYFGDKRSGVYLGHRRLSIIDLEGGQQPIGNEDGSIQIVFNGEIYNYLELRKRLVENHSFRTNTDTEVIVHLYEEMGDEFLRELNGMFAFAIFDANRRRVVLARDRIGKKPLFLREYGGRSYFASEIRSLLSIPEGIPPLRIEAFHPYFCLGYIPGPETIFNGIRHLPPAHWIEIRGGACSSPRRYWSLTPRPLRIKNYKECKEELKELLTDAIRIRLRSDVEFGLFLSGGVDSSIVTGIASTCSDTKLNSFTVSFGDKRYDEGDHATYVADRFQTKHTDLLVDKPNPTVLDSIVRHLDQPFADSSAVPTYLVSKAAGSIVKMVLSGDGGDELFGGYERYWKAKNIMSVRKILGPVLRWGGKYEERNPDDTRVGRKLDWYLHRLSNDSTADYIESSGIIPFADLRRVAIFPVGVPCSLHGIVLQELHEAGIKEDWQALDFRTYLPEDILVKVDRMSMANSLEVRSPLLDYRLAEYAFSLPSRWKMNRTEGKLILKDIGKDLLPGRFLSRRKQGFGVPLSEWFEKVLYARLDEYLSQRDPVMEEVIDMRKLTLLREEHRHGVWDFSEFLWALLVYYMWRETLE